MLEPGAVYIVLFRMASPKTYQWALVLATDAKTGAIYQNTSDGGPFYFDYPLHLNSTRFLVALKISRISSFDKNFHSFFARVLRDVPTEGHKCRSWLHAAIYAIAEQGFIGLQPNHNTITDCENEAMLEVIDAVENGGKVIESTYYRA